jgi:ribosomal protein S18 acetylase RimI-like enzyme
MTAESQDLTWRPLAVSDAAAMADLLNAIDVEDHVWGQYTVADATDELGSPIVDLPTSTLAVFDGPTMLGFSAVHYEPAAEVVHRMQAAGAVRPTHRRQGLGTRLLRHGLDTAQALHARHHPTLRLVVECIYGEHVHGAVALYRAAGMTATHWSRHMRHPLGAATPVAAIPDGLRIEGYTAETDEEFRAVRNDAFQTNGSARIGAEEWKVWAANANLRPELSFLLRDVRTGTAAGILLTVCWEAETAATGIRDAHLRVIGTRPAFRERGVAHALISHTLRVAQDQGYGRASLRVDADSASGAFGFAQRAGFVIQDTQVRYCTEP